MGPTALEFDQDVEGTGDLLRMNEEWFGGLLGRFGRTVAVAESARRCASVVEPDRHLPARADPVLKSGPMPTSYVGHDSVDHFGRR